MDCADSPAAPTSAVIALLVPGILRPISVPNLHHFDPSGNGSGRGGLARLLSTQSLTSGESTEHPRVGASMIALIGAEIMEQASGFEPLTCASQVCRPKCQ